MANYVEKNSQKTLRKNREKSLFENRFKKYRISQFMAALSLTAGLLGGSGAFAEQTDVVSTVDENVSAAIKSQLSLIAPNALPFAKISATPVSGLYQVQLGMDLIYMSADGRFLMNGHMIDLQEGVNLTEAKQAELRTKMMGKIAVSSMIVYPGKASDKGLKGRYLTVFTDIDCPYCTKLHNEIPALNEAGITVRYLAYPRAGVGSESFNKAVAVWCSDKPVEAMDKAMKKQTIEMKNCQNPVVEHMKQAQIFGVNGTPNIILDSGDLLPGYVPAEKLIEIFKNPA